MPGQRILIIQENPKLRMDYTRFFEESGFLVDAVPDGDSVLSLLAEKKAALVVADMDTPGFDAQQFLGAVNREKMVCQTVLLSEDPDISLAVSLMKLGAMDFLAKPVETQQLGLCAKRAVALQSQAVKPAGRHPSPRPGIRKQVDIITADPGMEKLLSLAGRVAQSSASVLIQGESGTGKELFARYIHEKSDRSDRPFIAVNCAALPENLLESELFGHEKGAFTGAISRKTGKFEMADTGTLFLDEITEMQFHLQAKLLRALQEQIIDRVGGMTPVEVDVRVIATTNRDAKEAVEQQSFRQDLYYRLNTIPLVIPPLRNRQGDLGKLCRFFIEKYSKIDGRDVKTMTTQAFDLLARHSFSGNVRELENVIHRAVLLADGSQIRPEDLMLESDDLAGAGPAPGMPSGAGPEPGSLKEMEEQMIYRTLDRTEGNRTHAAKILGISVRTLRNKLNEYKDKS